MQLKLYVFNYQFFVYHYNEAVIKTCPYLLGLKGTSNKFCL